MKFLSNLSLPRSSTCSLSFDPARILAVRRSAFKNEAAEVWLTGVVGRRSQLRRSRSTRLFGSNRLSTFSLSSSIIAIVSSPPLGAFVSASIFVACASPLREAQGHHQIYVGRPPRESANCPVTTTNYA